VGTVCLGQNKAKKAFAIYTMVIQFFMTIIALSLLGYYIGTKINSNEDLPILLAGVGLFIGVMFGFVTLYKFVKNEDRYEKNVHH
jgi:uncharacterized BrkB/YihY/UPF0761 family membrane protein